ncbi:hypothetical protein MTO96_010082 [Rhipicephalus appendiculatus]
MKVLCDAVLACARFRLYKRAAQAPGVSRGVVDDGSFRIFGLARAAAAGRLRSAAAERRSAVSDAAEKTRRADRGPLRNRE